MMKNNVLNLLYTAQDTAYKDFSKRLIPNLSSNVFIGVRTPILKQIARDMVKNNTYQDFIFDLPHKYFEENQLHAFIISQIRDFDIALRETERFLPYIDNWATCDQMSPQIFKKQPDTLFTHVCNWIKSDDVYTVRFGIKTLMQYWLDDNFDKKYADMVADIKSDEYYINMMRAWYFATGAAKHFDVFIPYFRYGRIDDWTRLRAIQKAIESLRVPIKNKEFLKSLRNS